jgi:hypothetical protein
MEILELNKMLDREKKVNEMKKLLKDFEENKNNLLFKKGIYIYGNSGSGKTMFVTNILKQLDYDIVKYDAGDIRNTSVIEEITKHNMADKNVMSLFKKKAQKIAIVMDEIDGMNNGDKGGINSLIKLIRPKKTKKQKMEEITMNPIICIGNYKVDKKIKELIKVCNVIEINSPTPTQIRNIVDKLFPIVCPNIKEKLLFFVQCDLRKIYNLHKIYTNNPNIFTNNIIENIFQLKSYNDDTKKITSKLLNKKYELEDHNELVNDTDRTSVGLLWHENIVDMIDKFEKKKSISFYINQLDNICFADYIDRVTFQKQIWQFNEMSSLIKTFKNNKNFHETFHSLKRTDDVRFTKVLTKYSTEYNNVLFIQKLCQKLGMDKKDLFGFFIELAHKCPNPEIVNLLQDYDISKLDINRIYRYIEKYTKENACGLNEKDVEDDEEYEYEEELEA